MYFKIKKEREKKERKKERANEEISLFPVISHTVSHLYCHWTGRMNEKLQSYSSSQIISADLNQSKDLLLVSGFPMNAQSRPAIANNLLNGLHIMP